MRLADNFKTDTDRQFAPTLRRPDFRVVSERAAGRLVQVIWNADMRNSHDGLVEIAKKQGIKIEQLEPGQFVCFVNSHKSQMKVLTSYLIGEKRYTAVASHRSPSGRIELRALRYITEAFGGNGKIDMDAALRSALEDVLTPKRRGHAGDVTTARVGNA